MVSHAGRAVIYCALTLLSKVKVFGTGGIKVIIKIKSNNKSISET